MCLKGVGTKSIQRGTLWANWSTERVNLSTESSLFERTLPAFAWAGPVKFCCAGTTAPDNGGVWHLYHLATENNTNGRRRGTKSPLCLEMGIRHTCLRWTNALKLPAYTGKRKNACISDFTWERDILTSLLNTEYRDLVGFNLNQRNKIWTAFSHVSFVRQIIPVPWNV